VTSPTVQTSDNPLIPAKAVQGVGTWIGANTFDPLGQLYNLRDDPAETNNLYLIHPEIVTRLATEMKRIEESASSRDSQK